MIEQIGNCTMILGDSLKIMKKMIAEGESVDLICSDPPYKLTSGGRNGTMGGILDPKHYDNGGDFFDGECPDWSEFMPLLFQILRDPGHAYIMANNRHVQNLLNSAESAGFYFHNLLVWDKITATANRWFMKNLEFIGFFGKGDAFMINDCCSKQLIVCPQVDESQLYAELDWDNLDDDGKPRRLGHPTEKPVALMQHYIENSTKPGQIVLDPFAGSFSTGVACLRSGRAFIGIEKNPRHFATGVERMKAVHKNLQGNLF